MKHKIFPVLLIAVMLLSGCSIGVDREAKCREYKQVIGGFTYYTSVALDQPFRKRFGEMALISIGVAVVSFFVGVLAKRFLGVDL